MKNLISKKIPNFLRKKVNKVKDDILAYDRLLKLRDVPNEYKEYEDAKDISSSRIQSLL